MPSPQNKSYVRNKPTYRLAHLLLVIVWLAALGLVAINRQNIVDWWRLRDYQAPAAISALADQDTMTPYGRKVFYVNRPAINDKSVFNQACPNHGGEQTIVLGCYNGGQAGIFLLSVDDPRLNGVQQVTAAHEMLHGAYERLSSGERKKVDAMLTDYYHNGLQDERIKKTIEAYKKSEPNDLTNEMHSVFGSEVAQLPAPLETYYQRYFTKRSQVAAFGAQYQAEFTSRRAQIDQYDAQLNDLKNQIDAGQASLKTRQAEINSEQARLNSLRSGGNIAAYNAGVPGYNGLIDDYNAEVARLQGLIANYNSLVNTRNAVALEADQLSKELSNDVPTLHK
ncbi:hypothetical protein COY17_01850 [Candidatus Saccharibacteria bacterium CG_4_10_14_0_2_um_filter_52_9]|nr:MAG: hypothetical protein COY17_01850 [Candidatus Saccharibacteria bacterium CG_4_10_14_0_2_um_filter_52_9]